MPDDPFDKVTDTMAEAAARLNEYVAVWQAAASANAKGTYDAESWLDDVQTMWVMTAKDVAKGWAAFVEAVAKTVPAGDEPEPEDGVSEPD